mgnify:CR=1 FL=1
MGQHMCVYEIEWTQKLTRTELEILAEEWGDYFTVASHPHILPRKLEKNI